MDILKSGLTAGILVAVLSAITVGAVGALAHDSDGGLLGFAGKWAAVSVAFGVMAAVAFGFVSGSFGWGGAQYFGLAIGLAIVLTVMEFLPLYGEGAFAPHWQVYGALNFVYALGFGYLVPKFMV